MEQFNQFNITFITRLNVETNWVVLLQDKHDGALEIVETIR